MIPAARSALEAVGGATLVLTKYSGHEKRCTREALEQGATKIVVLGGDGTISQVACELVRLKAPVPLAIFGAGTGNDFAKSLGTPTLDFPAMTKLIAEDRTRTIDAGQIDDTVFVNSAGFGFDVEVVSRTHAVLRTRNGIHLRGKVVYIKAALEQLFRFGGFKARVLPADQTIGAREITSKNNQISNTKTFLGVPPNFERGAIANDVVVTQAAFEAPRWLTMVFANGSWFGGSFHIAPDASIDDGLLDAVFIGDASPFRRVSLFARAAGGRHGAQPEVEMTRASQFVVEFTSPPLYQADGELHQATSAKVVIRSLRAAWRVFA